MSYSDIEERKKRHEFNHRNWVTFLLDLVLTTAASLLAILLTRWVTDPVFNFSWYIMMWTIIGVVTGAIGILVIGTQRIVISHSSLKSAGAMAQAVLIKEALMILVFVFNIFQFSNTNREVLLVVMDTFISLTLMILIRVVIISLNDAINDNPDQYIGRTTVMVYGTHNKSVALLVRLEGSSNYIVAGFISATLEKAGQIIQDHKVYPFKDEDDLVRYKRELGVQSILFAPDAVDDERIADLMMACVRTGLGILTTPAIDEMQLTPIAEEQSLLSQEARQYGIDSESIDFIPDGMSAFERHVKRFFDLVASGVLLIIFSPAFLACYIAIKMEDGGPAIYRQERMGRFGRPFYILKFRSMRTDAESMGPQLYSGDEDPRLTKVGKFLRQHHLDELPQLWNVFVGEMAFIGYRPERKFYIDQIMERDPRYTFLYQIRPGVTSYATLKNGYTDTLDKMIIRLEYDLYYLRHRSWWFDLKVLFNTFTNIVFGKVF